MLRDFRCSDYGERLTDKALDDRAVRQFDAADAQRSGNGGHKVAEEMRGHGPYFHFHAATCEAWRTHQARFGRHSLRQSVQTIIGCRFRRHNQSCPAIGQLMVQWLPRQMRADNGY